MRIVVPSKEDRGLDSRLTPFPPQKGEGSPGIPGRGLGGYAPLTGATPL